MIKSKIFILTRRRVAQKHFLVKYSFPCDILTDVNRLAFVNHYARKLFRSIHQQLVSNKDEVRIPSHFARNVYPFFILTPSFKHETENILIKVKFGINFILEKFSLVKQ